MADVINAAVKKVGGRWVKMLSGVKPGDVFMLRGTSKMDKEETLQDKARREIPNPSEIKAIIKQHNGKSSSIWAEIDKRFDKCVNANYKASDSTAKAAIKKWADFKENHKNEQDTL